METENTPSESIIEKAKEAEAAGTTAFMNPEPKKAKGKPGRPKGKSSVISDKSTAGTTSQANTDKASTNKPTFEVETKVICYPIVKCISVGGVAYTNNPRAALMPDEAEAMASALALVLDKYMPEAMKNYGPEMALALSLGQYGFRLHAIKQVMQDEARKNQPKQAEQARPQENHVTNNLVDENQTAMVL